MRIYLKNNRNPAKFHPHPIWNDIIGHTVALGFCDNKKHKNKNNNKISSDIGSGGSSSYIINACIHWVTIWVCFTKIFITATQKNNNKKQAVVTTFAKNITHAAFTYWRIAPTMTPRIISTLHTTPHTLMYTYIHRIRTVLLTPIRQLSINSSQQLLLIFV